MIDTEFPAQDKKLTQERAEEVHTEGKQLFQQGNMEAAVTAYSRSIALAGETMPWTFFERGEALIRLGRLPEAATDLQHSHQLLPGEYWPLKQLGIVYAQQGELAAAVTTYDQAIQLVPPDSDSSAWARYDKAKVLLLQGKAEGALPELEQAERVLPDETWLKSELGNTHLALGHLDQAEAYYRQSLERNAQNQQALEGLDAIIMTRERAEEVHTEGKQLFQQGNMEAAVTAYSRSIALAGETMPWTFFERGEALVRLGRLPEAATDLQHSHQLLPGEYWPLKQLGSVYATQGDLSTAITTYDQAIQLAPPDSDLSAWARYDKGKIMLLQGQAEGALPEFQQAERILPEDTWVKSEVGNAHLALGHLDQAEAYYREALLRNAENQQAIEGLVKIKESKRGGHLFRKFLPPQKKS